MEVQVSLPHTYVEPPFPGVYEAIPPTPTADSLIPNPNPLARRLVVNDNISITSDSTSESSDISRGYGTFQTVPPQEAGSFKLPKSTKKMFHPTAPTESVINIRQN